MQEKRHHESQEDYLEAKIDFRINRRPSQIKTSDTYARINWENACWGSNFLGRRYFF